MSSCSSAPRAHIVNVLIALVAATVVRRLKPDWIAAPVGELARSEGLRSEQVSRLHTRIRPVLEAEVTRAIARGRPRAQPRGLRTDAGRVTLLEALLDISITLHDPSTIGSRDVQDRLVAAQARLKGEHGLGQEHFCDSLGLSARTFRSWMQRQRNPRTSSPSPKAPSKRRERRSGRLGRFDLEHTLPGVQAMGDTTGWNLFGIPLKVVGVQDPGARKDKLWESFALDETESAELVVEAVREALADRPGAQFISDQGTPYMSQVAREAYDALEIEHAPAREGTPTDKATLERSFGTVKDALEPLAVVTRRLCEAVPSLRNARLAKAAGKLLLSTFLRVYEIGSRAGASGLRDLPPAAIESLVAQQRERARAEPRSVRLMLEGIHGDYDMEGSKSAFVRRFRRYHVDDIRDAECAFRNYACRCGIRRCDRYFAAVLRRVSEAGHRRRTGQWADQQRQVERQADEDRIQAHEDALDELPRERIRRGLDLLVCQWQPERDSLLASGHGLGRAYVARGLTRLFEIEAQPEDAVTPIWTQWVASANALEPPCVAAIRNVFEELVDSARSLTRAVPHADGASRISSLARRSSRGSTSRPPSGLPTAQVA